MKREPSYRAFLYEDETDVHLAFYSAIGRVCVVWANLEFQFDICCNSLYEVLGGDQLVKGPPHAFEKKLDFWKLCFKHLPALDAHQKQALLLATELGVASRDRNRLVHTHWGSLKSADRPPEDMSGHTLRPKRGVYFMRNTKISYHRILAFTEHIANLNTAVLPFVILISQERNRSVSEKSQRPGA